LTYSRVLKTWP